MPYRSRMFQDVNGTMLVAEWKKKITCCLFFCSSWICTRKSLYGEGNLYWVAVKYTGTRKPLGSLSLEWAQHPWKHSSLVPKPFYFFWPCSCYYCKLRRTRRDVLEQMVEEELGEDDELPKIDVKGLDFPDDVAESPSTLNCKTVWKNHLYI